MTSRVLILGGTGMLGSAVLSVFSENGIAATATTRDLTLLPSDQLPSFIAFDVTTDPVDGVLGGYGPGDIIVNCIGVIKHHMDDGDAHSRRNAIRINAEFPYALEERARAQGFTVVQIATDCVYSGGLGFYDESAAHDALDVYGKTKSLGEVPSASMLNLRCSIIGREQKNGKSLLEWVLAHPGGTEFAGYTDHLWNGVTAQAFARVVAGIIRTGNPLVGSYHLVPADVVDKNSLSLMILSAFGKHDVAVNPVVTGTPIDRTLSTLYPEVNARLWADAGYEGAPSIQDMVGDLVAPRSSYSGGSTS